MKVLVACEESQVVCKAFRAKGHEAYSNDIQECSGGHPEWHLQMDALKAIELTEWDLMIAFPPCTFLANSGAQYLVSPLRVTEMVKASMFFNILLWSKIPKIAIENPIQHGKAREHIRKYDQIINPWQFGDPYKKTTCIWVKGLPPLQPTNIVEPIAHWHSGSIGSKDKNGKRVKNKLPSLKSGSKQRSKTFPGIAQAMADQWG